MAVKNNNPLQQNRGLLCWLLAATYLMIADLALAQLPRTEPFVIAEQNPPIIDGKLNDEVWQLASPITDFHQTRPDDHGVPSERTEVQIARDSNFIYVSFRAYDSQIDQLVAKGLIQGQNFFSDDRLAVAFDTFNDRRNSYFFQVNPNGIRREALIGNDYFIDEWEAIWYAKTSIEDWGWSAEMAIPLKSLAFDQNGSTWGINFSRISQRRGENVAWASVDRNTNPSASGYIDNMQGFSQGRGLEIVPSLSVGHSEPENEDSETIFEPSVTGFYNVTSNLTAGLTLNTDFSGTEVDSRQVNLSRFSLFFPEKREFFLRDASIFQFGDLNQNGRPFFSRRIGLSAENRPLDIDAGVKLSGRVGDWNLGALAIQQEAGVLGGDESLLVGRVTRNVFNESEVGIIATSGNPNSALNNSLLGVDYSYRDSRFLGDQSLRANVWYQESDTEGINDKQRAYGASISYPNYKFDGFLNWRRIEENFNPALGFVNRGGVREIDSEFRYRHRLGKGLWQWFGTRVQYERSDRIDGGLQSEKTTLNLFEGLSRSNDFFTLFVQNRKEGVLIPFEIVPGVEVPALGYDSNRAGFFIETGQARSLRFELEVSDGEFFGGDNLSIEPTIEWRPNKHVFVELSSQINKIELSRGDFTSRLYSARLNFALNSEWAWLNVIQADNSSDVVSVNSRVRYQPKSNREYFLVFNQSRDRISDEVKDTSIIFKASFNYQL